MPPVRTKTIERRSPGAFETYKATCASTIEAGDVVRVTGTSSGDAYYIVQKALGDGSQAGQIMVATIKSNDGYLLVSRSDIASLDTSAATLGDPVYLSASVAGALTLVATTEQVGWVTAVGTSGSVSVEPASVGSGGATVTQDTIATIEAATPSAGDTGIATDGPYTYTGLSGGTWQAFYGGFAVSRPVFANWTSDNLDAGSTFSETSGTTTLFADDTGTTVKRQRFYQGISDDEEHIFGLALPMMIGSGTSNDSQGVGFEESGTGKVTVLQWASDGRLRVSYATTLDGTLTDNLSIASTSAERPFGRVKFCKLTRAAGTLTYSISDSPLGPWWDIYSNAENVDFTTAPDRVFVFHNNRNTGVDGIPTSLFHFSSTAA